MIQCTVCMEDYKCSVNYLSEPVDVYSEWIDACEEANKEDDWTLNWTVKTQLIN